MERANMTSPIEEEILSQRPSVERYSDEVQICSEQNDKTTGNNTCLETSASAAKDSSSTPSLSSKQSRKKTRIPPPIKQAPHPGSQPQANGIIKMKAADKGFWTEEIGLYNPRVNDLVEGTYADLWLLYPELRGEIMQRYHRYQRSQTSWRGKILQMPDPRADGGGS